MWGRLTTLVGLCIVTAVSWPNSMADSHEATAVIDLREAITRTLERNPELVVAALHIEARQGQVTQSGLRPNPELGVVVENVVGTGEQQGFDAAEITFSLGWILERGKLQHRVAVAKADVSLAEADAEVARLDVLAKTVRHFLDSLAYQARSDQLQSAVALAERTVTVVSERVRAGVSPQADLARAGAERARARLALEDVGHELKVANQRLSSQWGEVLPDFVRVSGDIDKMPSVPDFPELRARIERNPHLSRFLSQRRLHEAELRLAQAQVKPNWRVSAGIRHLEASGDQALVAGITLPLAWRNRNQGRIAQARTRLSSVDASEQAVRLQIESRLFALHQALEHSVHRATTLREEILPRVERALADTERAYASGRYGYRELQLLQAEVLNTQAALVEANIEAHNSVIEIERLTGTVVDRQEVRP